MFVHDGGAKFMPLSASKKTAVDSAGEERVGADADDAVLAQVALVGVVESPAE